MTEKPTLFSTDMIRKILAGRKTQTRRIIKNPPTLRHTYLEPTWGTSPPNEDGSTVDFGTPGLWGIAGPDYPDSKKDDRRCPYWADRLWCRETWQALHIDIDPETGLADGIEYAEHIPHPQPPGDHWTIVYKAADPPDALQSYVSPVGEWSPIREDRRFPWRPGIHMPRWACRLVLDVTSIRAERLQDIATEDIIAEGFQRLDRRTSGPGLRYRFVEAWDKLNGKRRGGSWAANPWVWVITFEVADSA